MLNNLKPDIRHGPKTNIAPDLLEILTVLRHCTFLSCPRNGLGYHLPQRMNGQTLFILPQPAGTPEISNSIGLCSQNGPVFTSLMKPTAEKYILCFLSRSTRVFFAMSPGFGVPGRDPWSGMASPSLIAGQY